MKSFKDIFVVCVLLYVLICMISCEANANGNNKDTEPIDTACETVSESTQFVSPGITEGVDIYHEGFGSNKKYVVVIDPGHQDHGMNELEPNGPDSDVMKTQLAIGTVGSFTQIQEYELNLAVSLKLRDELLKMGYTVVMIRETDNVNISNMERALIANKYKPDEENGYSASIYMRIHANGFSTPEPRGALMYCCTSQNPYTIGSLFKECKSLSDNVIEQYCAETKMPRRNMIMSDTLTGTNWSEIPTALIEMGFMSNETDDRLMATEEFRNSAAVGIARGIDIYFQSKSQ